MVEEGHLVGNHTYSHPDMSKISDLAVLPERNFQKNEAAYQAVTGDENAELLPTAAGKIQREQSDHGSRSSAIIRCFWSLAYVDWYVDQQPSHEEALMPS